MALPLFEGTGFRSGGHTFKQLLRPFSRPLVIRADRTVSFRNLNPTIRIDRAQFIFLST